MKNLPALQETWVPYLDPEEPLEKGNGNPLQYSCLENSQGQRSLADYGPWSRKESDMTEHTHKDLQHTHIILTRIRKCV